MNEVSQHPAQAVQQLATAYWASRCLHVAAELGVADVLGDEPQTAEAIAQSLGVQAAALHRILRALANHGVFQHDGTRFTHNESSRLLRTGVPGSMRSLARMMGLKVHWDAYRELDSAVRIGRPPISQVTKDGLFPYLTDHPEEGQIFNEAMAGKSSLQVGPVSSAYDFSAFRTIGDIGGGFGHLLYAVLEKAPQARGVLFDLPETIARARQSGMPRVTYVGGDFFKDPVPPCDAYMMMTVLHDWSDAESISILKNLQAGAPRGAKLLLVEGVVDPTARNSFILDLDIEMLALTTGRERTRAEWDTLLSRAGFRLTRIISTSTSSSIIEAELLEAGLA
jgi:O-methyltransferase/methyltransferase family protein